MALARPPIADKEFDPSGRMSGADRSQLSVNQSLSTWQYRVPKESSFAWFIAISLILFTGAVSLSVLIPRGSELPPMIEVDLGIDGVENEPPPLGEADAGAGEKPPEPEPEKPPEMEKPESAPEPEPVPEEPVVEQPPHPEPTPVFVVPEEAPVPKPAVKPVAKPKAAVPVSRPQSSPDSGSDIPGAKAGVRGSPTGQPGGKGGGRSDFLYIPRPKYDATARQRGYQGRGTFLITYQNGRVISVSTSESTGVPYLDALTIASLKFDCRLKSGVSGSVRYPIVWQLK